MNNQDRKIQIYKIRVSSLIEEHADVLAQAQEMHDKLQEAEQKIASLEKELRERNVQEKRSEPIIINHAMDTSEN